MDCPFTGFTGAPPIWREGDHGVWAALEGRRLPLQVSGDDLVQRMLARLLCCEVTPSPLPPCTPCREVALGSDVPLCRVLGIHLPGKPASPPFIPALGPICFLCMNLWTFLFHVELQARIAEFGCFPSLVPGGPFHWLLRLFDPAPFLWFCP